MRHRIILNETHRTHYLFLNKVTLIKLQTSRTAVINFDDYSEKE